MLRSGWVAFTLSLAGRLGLFYGLLGRFLFVPIRDFRNPLLERREVFDVNDIPSLSSRVPASAVCLNFVFFGEWSFEVDTHESRFQMIPTVFFSVGLIWGGNF